MSVWYCIPSARPPEEAEKVLKLWRERGYKIALLVDWNPPGQPLATRLSLGDLTLRGGGRFGVPGDPLGRDYYPDWNGYPGYARAVNSLVKEVMTRDSDADWFVTGGDDTEPDPNKTAEEIARECTQHFNDEAFKRYNAGLGQGSFSNGPAGLFGVMQPTGDRWHEGIGGFPDAPIDRVCGSPWLGREFCRRIYRGNGPIWPEFEHMYEDEHLQQVAVKLGILWQRRDLVHRHNHWGRGSTDRQVIEAKIPPHLVKWNERKHWTEAKAVYDRLKAGDFAEAFDLLP